MSTYQKRVVILIFAVVSAMFAANAAIAGDITIIYPTKENPVFSVTAPEDWKLKQAEGEGDYFTLESPTGVVLSFRSIAGTKDDLEAAIDDGIGYLKETYTDVHVSEPKSDGGDSFTATGSGKFKEDNSAWVFGLGWFALKNGNIAEIWFEAEAGDKEGAAEAGKILSTLEEK